MISYKNLQIGDRAVILGTVTDVSESGVQTIEPDMDAEGFVISRKLPAKHMTDKDDGWNECLAEITGGAL